jgi:hypothetical protein
LRATTLAFNAFALTGDEKYKQWILEYVDAWCQRAAANGGIMPSNIGLDGKIGGATGGKWYGGTYGWGFSVKVPQTGEIAHRNRTMYGFAGLENACLLTGDDRYLATWRKQVDAINAQRRMIGGRWMYPRMHGDQGWYDWHPQPYAENNLELYALSLRDDDRRRVPASGWLDFTSGNRPNYPETALQRDLARIRQRVAAMRQDSTTPDTRLADDPMKFNPCSVESLIELTLGGVHPGVGGNVLIAQLRYFDPERRRAGLPEHVAALVEKVTADELAVTLVNISQLQPRAIVIQGGAYGEHEIAAVQVGDQETAVGKVCVAVTLAPGAGAKLTLQMRRFRNAPTLDVPRL